MAVPKTRHILIEDVTPSVDGGRYPAKAILGDVCVVEADIFRDGQEPIQAVLQWRHENAAAFAELPMRALENDRWRAEIPLKQLGRLYYTIRAWTPAEGEVRDAVSHETVFELVVNRPLARFGAWYEMFVRSEGQTPGQSGTFRDAQKRLPQIKSMGFDVIYLAPIYPVGRTGRKGRNNSLHCAPGDPGSPWAIGNENGGHTAIEPALGSMEDFDRFVKAAAESKMEIALDFAPHCSPDHPWVREHPDWFYRRADGSIRCHENPPYTYEDIYPLNFDAPSAEKLYEALLHVFLFWASHGVKIFRVDNPHTKPISFWTWIIKEVHKKHPDAIFLGEAFTRPKMMKALSKAGFSQSYTYFIWRTSARELTEYLTELSDKKMACYFRPNFFTTTPDVLPSILQTGGRPAFLIRLALAATLSPSYGIVNGYELLENKALPDSEEYANSEKYEFKIRDWEERETIAGAVAKLNAIRRSNEAFQRLDNIHFIPTGNEQILAFAKTTADKSNVVIVAVNLDSNNAHQAELRLPMDVIGLPWGAYFEVEELMAGFRSQWTDRAAISLAPDAPAQIYRVKK